jgi:predicted nucleotidyltransferase
VGDPAVGDTIREKREAIIHIAGRHGATEVRLIGSVARGEARPDSDVDLLVTWSEGTSLLDHAALMLELEKLLDRKVRTPDLREFAVPPTGRPT